MGVPPWRAGTPLQYPYDQAFINNNSSPLNIPILWSTIYEQIDNVLNPFFMINPLINHIMINPLCHKYLYYSPSLTTIAIIDHYESLFTIINPTIHHISCSGAPIDPDPLWGHDRSFRASWLFPLDHMVSSRTPGAPRNREGGFWGYRHMDMYRFIHIYIYIHIIYTYLYIYIYIYT